MKLTITFIIFLLSISNLISQDFSDKILLNRKTEKIAKRNTQKELDSLSDFLKFKKRDRKIRKFKLIECESDHFQNEGSVVTPAGNFPKVLGCPGEFVFRHVQREKRSYYIITFFYNKTGEIVEKEISYVHLGHKY